MAERITFAVCGTGGRSGRPLVGLLAIALVAGGSSATSAADRYWSGTGTWNTSTQNWGTTSGGPYTTATWSNSPADTAFFEGTSGTVTLGTSITAAGLAFNVAGYTVTSGTLTLSGAGATIATAADATIASRIDTAVGLRKTGAGTLTLSGARSFTGTAATTLDSGTLRVTSAGFLNAAGTTTLINAGTLEIAGTTANTLGNGSTARPIEIAAGGTLLAANTVNNQNAHNLSTLTLNGGTLASNAVSGGGSGNFVLRTVNVGGSVRSTIQATEISLDNSAAQTWTINNATAGTDLLVSSVIRPSTNATLIKAGLGTLELSGSNLYAGTMSITAGTILAGNNSALGTGAVTIAAGGTLLTSAGINVSNTRTLSGGTLGFTSNATRGTVALLTAGSTGAGQALAPTTTWATGTGGATYSDVLSLSGTNGIAQVLSMNFSPDGLDQATLGALELGWFNTGTNSWVNAVAGNSTGTPTFFSGSWAAYVAATPGATPVNSLGVYGRDPVGNTVWAVINHNSDFAVIAVPEPTTAGLLVGAGLVAVACRRRR